MDAPIMTTTTMATIITTTKQPLIASSASSSSMKRPTSPSPPQSSHSVRYNVHISRPDPSHSGQVLCCPRQPPIAVNSSIIPRANNSIFAFIFLSPNMVVVAAVEVMVVPVVVVDRVAGKVVDTAEVAALRSSF